MPVIRRQAGRTPTRRDRRVVAPPGLEPDDVRTYLSSHRAQRADPIGRSRVRQHVGGRAGRLAVMYALGAALWIIATSWVTKAVDGGARFEMFKGLAFVVATAALLFAVLVTHERSAEASARRMRDLIESAGDVAYRYRRWPTPGFEYISDAITDWVGVTPEEHYRRPDIGVFLVHPGDRKRLSELLVLGTTSASVPLRWLTPDGRVLHTLHDVREVCDRRGRVIAVEGRIRDVTEERRGHGESAVAEGILAGLAGDLDATEIARTTCDRLVVLMEVDIAWVGVPLDDGSVRIVASHGGTRYVDGLVVRWDDTPHGQGPAGIAVREHRSVSMDPMQFGYGPWRQRAMDDGVTAALAVPLVWQGVAIGVLTVYSRFGNPFDQAFVSRFERTGERLALAMATARRLADDRESTAPRTSRAAEPFDVAAALADGRIEPWWQPQVTCPGARVAALEVLVRGRTLGGDVVLPHIVLPLAEEAGLMVQLGRAVRRRALAEAPRWFALGVERVAINASVVELVEPGFALELLRLLDEHGVPHDRIELEIVETAPLDARSVRALTEIAAAGVRVAVDDYGSGWASLGHLAQLPATTLKIDRVFVRDIGSSARADQLVRSTFDLAQALGLVAVAEGVETPEQAHALEQMGCHLLQGFLFATPMPTADVESLLRTAPRPDGDWARALLAP